MQESKVTLLFQEDYYLKEEEPKLVYGYVTSHPEEYNTKVVLKKHLVQSGRTRLGANDAVIGDVDVMQSVAKQLLHSTYHLDTYPECLQQHYHRPFTKALLRALESTIFERALFVKPQKSKKFTGKVVRDCHDLYGLAGRNTPVYLCPVVKWLSEFRVFVCEDHVIGIRNYEPGPEIDMRVVNDCVKRMTASNYHTYALDVGVMESIGYGDDDQINNNNDSNNKNENNNNDDDNNTDRNKSKDTNKTNNNSNRSHLVTAVVEVNEPYAVGSYGVPAELYTKFLIAGWNELRQQQQPKFWAQSTKNQ